MWKERIPGLLHYFQAYPWRGKRLWELHIDNTCFELNMDILDSFGGCMEPPFIVCPLLYPHNGKCAFQLGMVGYLYSNEYQQQVLHICPLMDANTLLSIPLSVSAKSIKSLSCQLLSNLWGFLSVSVLQVLERMAKHASAAYSHLGKSICWWTTMFKFLCSKSEAILWCWLELIDCNQIDEDFFGYHDIYHLDGSRIGHIAEKCLSLQSFSLTSPAVYCP
jgi:hypothetical protein